MGLIGPPRSDTNTQASDGCSRLNLRKEIPVLDAIKARPQCLALASGNAGVGGAISFGPDLDDRPDQLAIFAAMILLDVMAPGGAQWAGRAAPATTTPTAGRVDHHSRLAKNVGRGLS